MRVRNYRANNSKIDDLSQDVKELEIEISSYKKCIKLLSFIIPLFLFIFAYFGYDKFESIKDDIMKKANQRLAETDSLLSEIDTTMISKLKSELGQNINLYKETLSNLEEAIRTNKELRDQLLQNLPDNEIITTQVTQYYVRDPQNIFSIEKFDMVHKSGQKISIFLKLNNTNDGINLTSIDIKINRHDENSIISVRSYSYKPRDGFNKLKCSLNIDPGKYKINIGVTENRNDKYYFYREVYDIEIE